MDTKAQRPTAEIERWKQANDDSSIAALVAYILKLEAQLEHEHLFDAANDRFAAEQPPWLCAKVPTPQEAYAYFHKRAVEPSDAAISLAKFIPLDHQSQLISNPVMWALDKWLAARVTALAAVSAAESAGDIVAMSAKGEEVLALARKEAHP